MKYYKDDIVEVLNCKDSKFEVCHRYRIKYDEEPSDEGSLFLITGSKEFDWLTLDKNQLILYKRPLKNWLKYIWWLIRK